MAERRRPRYRYIVFKLDPEQRLGERAVGAILAAALARHNIRLVHWEDAHGIVRCVHTAKDDVIASLNGNHEVDGRFVRIKTIGTSGTIRRARSKFLS